MQELQDKYNYNRCNILVIGILERNRRIYEVLTTENVPKLKKDIKTQVQEAQRKPTRVKYPKKSTKAYYI